MRQHDVTGACSNSNIISAYAESIAYDANGNIQKYLRKGANTTGNPLDMDSLSYKYNYGTDGRLVNNRLNHVRDQVDSSNYHVDIDDQENNNYEYDRIGNLKKDIAEGIDTIRWTTYSRINRIVKNAAATVIDYSYNAAGNRTSKTVTTSDGVTSTFYVRDAQGNVLSIYSIKDGASVTWNEQELYGRSRIGAWNCDTIVPTEAPIAGVGRPIADSLVIGSRAYELTNHLADVLATISDKKVGHDSSGIVDYFVSDVQSENDYYPFGMQKPGRRYSSVDEYRYGFNGKENDNEVKGQGKQQDYGLRIYDPRLGRFLSVDPLTKKYPDYTPYSFAGNKPIFCIDLDGGEDLPYYWQMKEHTLWENAKTPEQRQQLAEKEAKVRNVVLFTIAIASDVFLTRGRATQLLLTSEVIGAFEHNRGKTPEERAAQDQRRNEALTDAILTYGMGKVVGGFGKLGAVGITDLAKIARNRLSFAKEFYMTNGYSETAALDHIKGIDLSEKVYQQTLKKGTILEQYAYPDRETNLPRMGNYFALPGEDASKLGIGLKGRLKITLQLEEDVTFLRSTTATVKDWIKGSKLIFQGGETQLFSNTTKYKVLKVENYVQ